MYTVEFDHDEITVTLVDDTANHEDVVVNSFDDIVYVRQWNEEFDRMQTIAMSVDQWEELIAAIDSPEGAFMRIKK